MKGVPGGEFIEQAMRYCVDRNNLLGLDPDLVARIKQSPFLDWSPYELQAYQDGPDSPAFRQYQLLQQLTTIAFVNDCLYSPRPTRISKKQPAPNCTPFPTRCWQQIW